MNSFRLDYYLSKYVLKNKEDSGLIKLELKIAVGDKISDKDFFSFFETYFSINATENYTFIAGSLESKFSYTFPYFTNDDIGREDLLNILTPIDDFFMNLKYKKSRNIYKFYYDSPTNRLDINILNFEICIIVLKNQTDFLI